MKNRPNSIVQLFSLIVLTTFSFNFSFAQTINDDLIKELVREKTKGIQIENEVDLFKDDRSDFSETGAEPFIAIDPNNDSRVGISFMGNGGNWHLFLSEDSGETWENANINTSDVLSELYPDDMLIGGGDPVFIFGENDSIHVAWLYLHGTNLSDVTANPLECFYLVSGDFGTTWESKPSIHSGLLSSFDAIDRIWMARDNSSGPYEGNIYLSAVHFVNSPSGDAGELVFIKPTDSSDFNFMGSTAVPAGPMNQTQFGNVAVDESGTVHLSCALLSMSSGQIAYAQSTDGGETFSDPIILASGTLMPPTTNIHDREGPAVSLAVDGNNIYVAWTDFAGGTVKSYYAYSHDGGTSFSDQIEFAAELNGSLFSATMPCVAADEGHLAISWYTFNKETLETK